MRRWIALLTLAALAGTGIAAADCAMPAAGTAAVADDAHEHAHEHGGSPSKDGSGSERDGAGCTFAMTCAGAAVLAPVRVSERSVEHASADRGLEPDRAHASASPTRHTPPPRLPA